MADTEKRRGLTLIYQNVSKWDYSITWKTTFKEGGSILNLSNMFPASGGLAAQIKKPVATAVAKAGVEVQCRWLSGGLPRVCRFFPGGLYADKKTSGRMGDQMAETS